MFRRILVLVLFLLAAPVGFAQTIRQLNVSPTEFTAIPGTPRAIYNNSRNVWVVLWRQAGAIKARTVKADGTMTPPKNLAIGTTAFDQNFDIAFNSINFTYLAAFENAAGLQVRFANTSLVPGATRLVEAGARGSMPRLVFDPAGGRYFLFWLGTVNGSRTQLKSRIIDATGVPTGATTILNTAPAGRTNNALNVARNPMGGAMVAMLLQQTPSAGLIQKINISPAGTLLGAVTTFQPLKAGLASIGSLDFSTTGTGFGLWSDLGTVKRRKLTSTLAFGSGPIAIQNVADVNSRQTGIDFSSSANRFIGAWTRANQLLMINLNSTTGAPLQAAAPIATSNLAFSRNAFVSADTQGGALILFEDSTVDAATVSSPTARFRVRGALVPGSGGGGGGGGTVNVSIVDNAFSPRAITISRGTQVVWTNNGTNPHTVTSGAPGDNEGAVFDSPTLGGGSVFRFTFNTAGTFPYYCRVHGASMSGTVTVN